MYYWHYVEGGDFAGYKKNPLTSPKELLSFSDKYYENHVYLKSNTMTHSYGERFCSPNYQMINHFSNNYVLLVILSGKAWCNGIPVEAGDLIYLTKSQPYNFSSNSSDPCVYGWVSFGGGKSERYIEKLMLSSKMQVYRTENIQEIYSILHDMLYVEHSETVLELYIESQLIHILSLAAANEKQNQALEYSKRVSNAIEYISKNYQFSSLRIADAASAANISEKYLRKLFKQETGLSIREFITKTRMDAAVQLLKSSNYNINEIAEFVGYNDHRNFSEIFKKHFHCTPSKFTEN